MNYIESKYGVVYMSTPPPLSFGWFKFFKLRVFFEYIRLSTSLEFKYFMQPTYLQENIRIHGLLNSLDIG